ncbi:MAG: DUF448 domain-containing protein [Malacoplasma sp.]|nr:DUF448 domain-containing protein [Malacoplasma sp.]
MNKKNNKVGKRLCCLSNQVIEKEKMIRITKVNDSLIFNNFNAKGRSVYFLLDAANATNQNKLFNTIKRKLKFNLSELEKLEILKLISVN